MRKNCPVDDTSAAILKRPQVWSDPLHAIHQRLFKRQRRTGDRGLIAVGIGWAMKAGKPDSERGLGVLYLVKHKKKLAGSRRIPKRITVFLTKGRGARRRRYRATFSTDVVEMLKPARPTGFLLDGGTDLFTGGAVVYWPEADGSRAWGLLSVSHGVQTDSVVITPPAQSPFNGRVRAHTDASEAALDAVLIELNPDDVSVRTILDGEPFLENDRDGCERFREQG
jgi:hypothetical protein